MSKVKSAYETYRTVFENHKNLLSFTATALSCMAAYLGYLQRMRHQQKLEEQLQELNQTISHEKQLHTVDISKKTSDVSMIALFMASSALLGYSIGRFHGRRSAIKRFVSLTNPQQTLSKSSPSFATSSSMETGSAMAAGTVSSYLETTPPDNKSYDDNNSKESREDSKYETNPQSSDNNEKSSPLSRFWNKN